MRVRRHTGEADSICHLPVGLARLIVAHAHHPVVAVAPPKLRSLRKHVFRKCNIVARGAMAARALSPIHLGARFKNIFTDSERSSLQFTVNARIQWKVDNLLLEWKGLVGNRNRQRPELEIRKQSNRDGRYAEQKAKKDFSET